MELDILHQILTELKELKQGQVELKQSHAALEKEFRQSHAELKQGYAELKQGYVELKQGQTRLETIIETEVIRDIKIIAENHLSLNQKLDDLKDLSVRVLELRNDTDALQAITKDNVRDLKALKGFK